MNLQLKHEWRTDNSDCAASLHYENSRRLADHGSLGQTILSKLPLGLARCFGPAPSSTDGEASHPGPPEVFQMDYQDFPCPNPDVDSDVPPGLADSSSAAEGLLGQPESDSDSSSDSSPQSPYDYLFRKRIPDLDGFYPPP